MYGGFLMNVYISYFSDWIGVFFLSVFQRLVLMKGLVRAEDYVVKQVVLSSPERTAFGRLS